MEREILKRIEYLLQKLPDIGYIPRQGPVRVALYNLLSPYGMFYDFVLHYYTNEFTDRKQTEDVVDMLGLLAKKQGSNKLVVVSFKAFLDIRNRVIHRMYITFKRFKGLVYKFINLIRNKGEPLECEIFLLQNFEELLNLEIQCDDGVEDKYIVTQRIVKDIEYPDDIDTTYYLHRLKWFYEKGVDMSGREILVISDNLNTKTVAFQRWTDEGMICQCGAVVHFSFHCRLLQDTLENRTLKWYKENGYREFLKGVKIRKQDGTTLTIRSWSGTSVVCMDGKERRNIGVKNIVAILNENGEEVQI